MLSAEAHARHGDLETARERTREAAVRAEELGEHYLGHRLAALSATLTESVGAGTS